MAGSDNEVKVTKEERAVMRECVKEARYRSIPAAAITGDDNFQIMFRDEVLYFLRAECQLCNQDRKD